MNKYIINENTLAIKPFEKNKSIVYENDNIIVINKRPINIIKENCIYYGYDYSYRLKQTEMLTGFNYKTPIVIDDDKVLVLFPTTSPRLKKCVWINLYNLNKFKINSCNNFISLLFENNKIIDINSSYNIINNQVNRASRLEYQFLKLKRK